MSLIHHSGGGGGGAALYLAQFRIAEPRLTGRERSGGRAPTTLGSAGKALRPRLEIRRDSLAPLGLVVVRHFDEFERIGTWQQPNPPPRTTTPTTPSVSSCSGTAKQGSSTSPTSSATASPLAPSRTSSAPPPNATARPSRSVSKRNPAPPASTPPTATPAMSSPATPSSRTRHRRQSDPCLARRRSRRKRPDQTRPQPPHHARSSTNSARFPHGKHDDCVDALSGAHNTIDTRNNTCRISIPKGRIDLPGFSHSYAERRYRQHHDPHLERIATRIGATIWNPPPPGIIRDR